MELVKYNLVADNGLIEQFNKEYPNDFISDNGEGIGFKLWNESEDQLREFSKKFPGEIFELNGEGEYGKEWKEFYKNGKKQDCEVVVCFEDFDENKLK